MIYPSQLTAEFTQQNKPPLKSTKAKETKGLSQRALKINRLGF